LIQKSFAMRTQIRNQKLEIRIQCSAGFTLVELLVVIAIIGVLVALLLPGVQAAREAARRMQCSNNLKQHGLALHNYHSAHHRMPSGSVSPLHDGTVLAQRERRGWLEAILPFLDEQALFEKLSGAMPFSSYGGYTCFRPGAEIVLPVMSCPSEILGIKNTTLTTSPPNGEGAFSNYTLCVGNDYSTSPQDSQGLKRGGMFYARSKIKFSEVVDGTSHTVMGSEIMLSKDMTNYDTRGIVHSAIDGGCLFSTIYTPNHGTIGDYTYQWCQPIPGALCLPPPGVGSNQWTHLYILARSYHSGGVNTVFADGSGRFVSAEVDQAVWRAVGSRAGDEMVGDNL
jgi:prepilin-type N-terminal cleavage/methylation domain-containing protein/prepilin-type processing-associated H-X9-DG protein